jgi:allantoinase
LIESGVDEFPMSREADLRIAMPILARAGVPLLVHAELESGQSASHTETASREYRDFLKSRPGSWETDAIRLMIRLASETGCRTHIVHLSNAEALEDLKAARSQGVPISAETCPHYLYFEAEKIPDGATQFKCAPPIREHANREALWQGLKNSEIDFIVSDHSPCVPRLKNLESGDFSKAWGGISGLQFSVSVAWTEMKRRGLQIQDLSRWMSVNTSRFIGLEDRKGQIIPGFDADLVVWSPELSFTVDRAKIFHRHNLTPYEGQELFGIIHQTFVGGHLVYDQGQIDPKPNGKQILNRKHL